MVEFIDLVPSLFDFRRLEVRKIESRFIVEVIIFFRSTMFGRAINACIRVQCNRSLSRPSVAWNHATSLYRNFSDWNDWNDDEFKPKRMHLINEEIPHPNLRVTYYENGESKWELLSKSDALRFARQRNLDLVLGIVAFSFAIIAAY